MEGEKEGVEGRRERKEKSYNETREEGGEKERRGGNGREGKRRKGGKKEEGRVEGGGRRKGKEGRREGRWE